MVVKGIIKSIDYNGNTCMVRIPLFENTTSSNEVVMKAIISTTPGIYNGYKENDVVIVTFENNEIDMPIVLGKLYLGVATEKETPRGAINCDTINSSTPISIPIDTKLTLENDAADNTTVGVDNDLSSYTSIADIARKLQRQESAIGTMNVKIIDDGESLGARLTQVEADDLRHESEIIAQADNIRAKVDKVKDTGTTGFGWKLTDSNWKITSHDDTREIQDIDIMKVDVSGVSIAGNLKIEGYPTATVVRYCQISIANLTALGYKEENKKANPPDPDINDPEDPTKKLWRLEAEPAYKDDYYTWRYEKTVTYKYDPHVEYEPGVSLESYVGFEVKIGDNYTLVTNDNKSTLGIVPGTTKRYEPGLVEISSYIYDVLDDGGDIYTDGSGNTITRGGGTSRALERKLRAVVDGKNACWYQATEPDPSPYENKVGDCWFDTGYHNIGATANLDDYVGYYIKTGSNPDAYTQVTEANKTTLSITPGTTVRYEHGILKQWNGTNWVDIGGEIVANKVTAAYINGLHITAMEDIQAGIISVAEINKSRAGQTDLSLIKAAEETTAEKNAKINQFWAQYTALFPNTTLTKNEIVTLYDGWTVSTSSSNLLTITLLNSGIYNNFQDPPTSEKTDFTLIATNKTNTIINDGLNIYIKSADDSDVWASNTWGLTEVIKNKIDADIAALKSTKQSVLQATNISVLDCFSDGKYAFGNSAITGAIDTKTKRYLDMLKYEAQLDSDLWVASSSVDPFKIDDWWASSSGGSLYNPSKWSNNLQLGNFSETTIYRPDIYSARLLNTRGVSFGNGTKITGTYKGGQYDPSHGYSSMARRLIPIKLTINKPTLERKQVGNKYHYNLKISYQVAEPVKKNENDEIVIDLDEVQSYNDDWSAGTSGVTGLQSGFFVRLKDTAFAKTSTQFEDVVGIVEYQLSAGNVFQAKNTVQLPWKLRFSNGMVQSKGTATTYKTIMVLDKAGVDSGDITVPTISNITTYMYLPTWCSYSTQSESGYWGSWSKITGLNTHYEMCSFTTDSPTVMCFYPSSALGAWSSGTSAGEHGTGVGSGSHSSTNFSTATSVLNVTGDVSISGTASTGSDKRIKNSISYKNIDEYSKILDNLKPVTYKLNSDFSGQTHIGLIAQDVNEAIEQANIDPSTMAMVSTINTVDLPDQLFISYQELHGLEIYKIQQLEKRIKELEDKLDKLSK